MTASLETKGNAGIMHLCSFVNYMQNCSGLSKPLSDLELVSRVDLFFKSCENLCRLKVYWLSFVLMHIIVVQARKIIAMCVCACIEGGIGIDSQKNLKRGNYGLRWGGSVHCISGIQVQFRLTFVCCGLYWQC